MVLVGDKATKVGQAALGSETTKVGHIPKDKAFFDLETRKGTYEIEQADDLVVSTKVVTDHDSPTYLVGEMIGVGAEGVIFSATQCQLEREVALKSLKENLQNREMAKRLSAEARRTATLDHPHIVPIYDLVVHPLNPTVVMKKTSGKTWSDLLEKDATSLLSHLEILQKVCDAVSYAHASGIIHRDIKPANVLVGEFGEVYLADWGISGTTEEFEREPGIFGTPAYMAPEMVDGDPITSRTDVYLLGGILYHILEGCPPHEGDSLMKIMASIAKSSPDFNDATPPILKRLALDAMAPLPKDRPQSVTEFKRRLSVFMETHGAYRLLSVGEKAHEQMKQQGPESMQHYYQARFAYDQALQLASDFEPAKKKMTELMTDVVQWQLSQGNYRVSLSIAGSSEYSTPELLAHCEREIERNGQRSKEDPSLLRARQLIMKALIPIAVFSLITRLLREWLRHSFSEPVSMLLTGLFLFSVLALFAWKVRHIKNRWLLFGILAMAGLQVSMMIPPFASLWVDFDVASMMLARKVAVFSVLTTFALIVEPRVLVASVTYAVGILCEAIVGDTLWLDVIMQMGSYLLIFLILMSRHNVELTVAAEKN